MPHDEDAPDTSDKSYQFKIEKHGDAYSIKSLRFNQYIFTGNSILDERRRNVLSWAGDETPDDYEGMLFNINPF